MSIIAIEGIDGSGKSLQFDLIHKRLESMGKKSVTLSFPVYDSFTGVEIGSMLSGRNDLRADNVDPKSMALWYAVNRLCSLRDIDYYQYDYILLNRYTLSNAVYQSLRIPDPDKTSFAKWVFDLEHRELRLPQPDIYIVLDVDEEMSFRNVKRKGFRDYVGDQADVYERSSEMMRAARSLYLEFSKIFEDIEVVSCVDDGKMLPPELIHNMIWSKIEVTSGYKPDIKTISSEYII